MLNYSKILLDNIEREKDGTDFSCKGADKLILNELLREINEYAGTHFRYLAELDAFNIHGAGPIVARYISRFSSESVRGYLIPQLASDKIPDCDKIILQLYLHFKASDEYISRPGVPAPAHIYVRYDNAIRWLRPKRIKADLLKLAGNPRDAFYLPFTMRMLASWRIAELNDILLSFLSDTNISAEDVGLGENDVDCFPPLTFIKRELMFTGIEGLKYYPSAETTEIIKQFANDPDWNIRVAAQKTLKYLSKV